MRAGERRRQRALLTLALREALLPIVRLLRPRMGDAEWRAVVEAAYPAVYRGRMDHWRLAERVYRAERARVLGDGGPVEFPRRNYPPDALDAAWRERVKPRLDALDEDDDVPELIVEEAVSVADRHAKDAGRQAEIDAARHDPRAIGYARRLSGVVNCAFCVMLASRGPVYKSAESALVRHEGRGRSAVATGEPFHDRCDCEVVPVFDRQNWDGRAEYERLRKLWDTHGGTLKDFRRYLDEQQEEARKAA